MPVYVSNIRIKTNKEKKPLAGKLSNKMKKKKKKRERERERENKRNETKHSRKVESHRRERKGIPNAVTKGFFRGLGLFLKSKQSSFGLREHRDPGGIFSGKPKCSGQIVQCVEGSFMALMECWVETGN